MNGPVAPAASPAGPYPGRDVRGRLGEILLAPIRSLAFFGLTLAGAVLLVGVVGPAVVAVLGLGHLALDLQRQGAWRGGDGLYLLVGIIGLTFCRFLSPATLLGVRRLGMETRLLSARWCGVAIPAAYRPSPAGRQPDGRPGAVRLRYQQRMDWLLSDPGTWKDLLWLGVNAVAGTVMLLVPIALVVYGALVVLNVSLHPVGQAALSAPERVGGALLLAAGAAAGPWLLRAYGGLARLVLAPSESSVLEQRVAYLAQTRQESLDTGAAELRRIERDLHDGAQARLVAMGLTLDAAGRLIDTDPAAARSLLIEARDASAKALAELRDLVRGVHPPVLADRGLADAVRALALDAPVRARVTGSLDGRPPAPVESAAYFAVSELLANVAKHAAAQSAEIDLRHSLGALRISVRDDGDGGANPSRGTGLRGVERRIAAFDGVLAISSPAGGPTAITMEIPCALS
jgi:signal transduction histidine kinase